MEEAGWGEKGCETRGWREQGPAEEGQDSHSHCRCSVRVPQCPATGCSTTLLLLFWCCMWYWTV